MAAPAANTLLGLANISPLVVIVFLAGLGHHRQVGAKRAIVLFLFLTGRGHDAGGRARRTGVKVGTSAWCCSRLRGRLLSPGVRGPVAHRAAQLSQPGRRLRDRPPAFILGGGLLPDAPRLHGPGVELQHGIIIIGAVIAVGSTASLGLKLLTNLEEGC